MIKFVKKQAVRKLLFALIFFVQTNVYSQVTLNALSFDGVDDEAVITGASSLIAGGTGISMAFWVYPENAPTGFPDFDGMAGFRNNTNADFYVLQLSASSIEARFRPSTGLNTDITFSGLLLNQWQHIAFTHNGSELKFYHDGVLISSLAASGNISNTSTDLLLGNLYYQGTPFNFQGKLDEFLLLDRELSQAEIACLSAGHADTTMSGLKLFYDMNLGIPGGANTGQDTLTGLSGQSVATLMNFALTDSVSNWVEGINNVTFIQGSVCPGNQYSFMNNLYSPGEYLLSAPDSQSCQALYHLTVNQVSANIDTSVSVNGNILSAAAGASSYQWVNCALNYLAIPGATNSSFTAGAAGSYACIIGSSGCFDTTRCITNGSSFIKETEAGSFRVYPVPAREFFTIEFVHPVQGELQVFDVSGRCIEKRTISSQKEILQTENIKQGIYRMVFTGRDGRISQQALMISSK